MFYFLRCFGALQNQPSNESSRLRTATPEQTSSILTSFPRENIFQHYNALIHTAKQSLNFLQEAQITHFTNSSQSPDLNPIEHLWTQLSLWQDCTWHRGAGQI